MISADLKMPLPPAGEGDWRLYPDGASADIVASSPPAIASNEIVVEIEIKSIRVVYPGHWLFTLPTPPGE